MDSANPLQFHESPSTSSRAGNESNEVVNPNPANTVGVQVAQVTGRKYPLQHIWTLWYFTIDPTKTWEEMQTEVASIDTVEDFWSLYNFIIPASQLNVGCDYSLFKINIKPMWEDPANRNGGRWLITLPREQSHYADELWTDVQLLLIGAVFAHDDQVNGAVINVRPRNYKISIWTSNGANEAAITEIGNVMCAQLHIRPGMCQYQLHADVMNGTATA